jgi:sporulation protein YlmC with PRC-barrel domain
MLEVGSALKGYAIEASDGRIGTVDDFLFDDRTWKIRWLVVDTGSWLTGRKVLIHPSAIGRADYERRQLSVSLTKSQVKGSPDLLQDQPVSQQMERSLYDYYGWDPYSGSSNFGMGLIEAPLSPSAYFAETALHENADIVLGLNDGDPHLRSVAAVTGYHIHASDGQIGHIENFLIDDATWDIRYLIIDMKNWWPGKHVLMSPYAVREISWSKHQVRLDVSSEQVKSSLPWDPLDMIDRGYEKRLHSHYD